MRRSFIPLVLALVGRLIAFGGETNWPQFRGEGGLGLGTGKPPVEFGEGKNVKWKMDVPHGHSSPCIWGDKIFLTGFDNGKLVTFCLSRTDGHELWRGLQSMQRPRRDALACGCDC